MTRPSLAAITRRAEAATEGPWSAGRGCVVAPVGAPSAAHSDAESVLHYGGALIGESIARAEDRAFIADARTAIPALSAAVRDVLALHAPEWSCGNPAHTNPDVGCPECGEYCIECGDPFPCRTYTAITAHIDTTPKETP